VDNAAQQSFALMFRSGSRCLINTVALARCRGRLGILKLFQQFFTLVKPLKRLSRRRITIHRAEATVLMKLAEISRSLVSAKDFALGLCLPVVYSAFADRRCVE
jgi:hypothetical protein